MPPPPGPQKGGGMSGAMIALIVVVLVLVVGGGGCAACMCASVGRYKDRSTQAKNDPPPKSTPPPPQKSQNDNWITAERPYVKFHPPAGWSTEITTDKEWGIFRSRDGNAVFAFTTFNQPGESTRRLGRAASVLGVSGIEWKPVRNGTVGVNRFPARVGDGTCNFKGPNGYIWYATVDSGTADQMLLIFTVTDHAPKARREEAQAAVDSLQKR
jgi:hypothetical protein